MMNIRLYPGVEKFLKKRSKKEQRQIAKRLILLRENPEPHWSIQLSKPYTAYRRARAGEFRIVYNVHDEELHVYVIDKRNDDEVYKHLSRLVQ